MDASPSSVVRRLRPLFEAHADGKRAADASRYMREQFVFFGIPAPVQAQLAREATRDLRPPTESQLGRTARACWREHEREWQYFACGYVRRHIRIASADFIDVARHLVTTKAWWDTVDALASRTVGPLVRAHPELGAVMDRWIESDDRWLARTAILHQLTYKEGTDSARLYGYCRTRASDSDFFIRKAIGWALREYSKTDPDGVRRFVAETVLSGLSRTEALKWLERRAGRGPHPAVEND